MANDNCIMWTTDQSQTPDAHLISNGMSSSPPLGSYPQCSISCVSKVVNSFTSAGVRVGLLAMLITSVCVCVWGGGGGAVGRDTSQHTLRSTDNKHQIDMGVADIPASMCARVVLNLMRSSAVRGQTIMMEPPVGISPSTLQENN